MTPPTRNKENTDPDIQMYRNGSSAVRVPYALIGIVVALLIQAAAGLWLIADISARANRALELINDFRTGRYTTFDAQRDREIADGKIELNRQAVRDLERRLIEVEAAHRSLVRNQNGNNGR